MVEMPDSPRMKLKNIAENVKSEIIMQVTNVINIYIAVTLYTNE